MSRHFARPSLVVATALLAGCAHAQLRQPEDTVEAARLTLTELTTTEDGLCAAERVDAQWTTRALQNAAPEQARPRLTSSAYWRERGAEEMNLSQASVQMAQAYEQAKSADAARHDGVPGALYRSHWARQSFDAFADQAATDGVRSLRPGQGSVTEANLASAEYAAVWSSWFALPDSDPERGALLDWLTSRSIANPDVLDAYQSAFEQERDRGCATAR